MSIITGLIGIFLLLVGSLITRFNLVEVIAGYEPNKVKDKEGLARWVGGHLMVMGILGVVSGFLGYFFSGQSLYIALVYFLTIPVLAVKTALGSRRFEK